MSRLGRGLLVLVAAGGIATATAGGASAQEPRRPAGPGPAAADTSGLTVLEAVEEALATYPSVRAAEAAVASAEAAAGRATSERWPDLSLRASATRYEEPMLVSPIHGFEPGATPPFDEALFEAGAYLDYTLHDFGARSARIRGARRATSAAEAERRGTRQELVARVAGTYLEALGLRGVLDAHDRRIAALAAERERVARMEEVGRAARVEGLRVEAALAGARSDREEIAAELDVATRQLRRLTGVSAGRVEPEALPEISYDGEGELEIERMTARAVDGNPAVRQARRQRETASAGLDLARAARWPELKLGAGWVDRGSADGDFQDEWSVGVGLSVPLFTGGRVTGEVEKARAEETGAEQRVRLAEKAVERAVDRAHASVREKAARVRSLRRAVDSQEEVVRIEQLRLETGAGTQTDYLDAEAQLLSVRADLARTRYAALRARVELARATGDLSREWIERNLETRP